LEKVDYTPTTVVIYLRLASLDCEKQNQEPEQVIGVVVDAVSEVYAIEEKDKKPTPGIIGAVEEKYIEAIALVGEKMVAIIDMHRVFDLSELKSLAGA
jgi:purine-binding chemotaxis protein CheW